MMRYVSLNYAKHYFNTLFLLLVLGVSSYLSVQAITLNEAQVEAGLTRIKAEQQYQQDLISKGFSSKEIQRAKKGTKRRVATGLPLKRQLYVNPKTGSDTNPGTARLPFKTLDKLSTEAKYGDRVNLAAGQYPLLKPLKFAPGVRIVGAGLDRTFITAEAPMNTMLSFNCSGIKDCANAVVGVSLDGRDQAKLGIFSWQGTRHVYAQNFYKNFNESGIRINGNQAEVSDSLFLNAADRHGEKGKYFTGALYFENFRNSFVHDNVILENIGGGIKSVGGAQRNLEIYNNQVVIMGNAAKDAASIEIWDMQQNCRIYRNKVNAWLSFVQQLQRTGAAPVASSGNVHFYENEVIATPGVTDNHSGVEIAIQGARFSKNLFSGFKSRIFWMEGWSRAGHYYTGDLLFDENIILNPSRIGGIAGIGPNGDSVKNLTFKGNAFFNTSYGISIGQKPENTYSNIQVLSNQFVNTGSAVTAYGKAGQYQGLVLRGNTYTGLTKIVSGNANPPYLE